MLQKVVNRLLTILLSFFGLISVSAMANVQHDMPNYETLNSEVSSTESTTAENSYNTDDLIISPVSPGDEAKKEAVKNNSPSKAKVESEKKSKEEKPTYGPGTNDSESVLSFNFLYYIIQKFKFTDIQDQ